MKSIGLALAFATFSLSPVSGQPLKPGELCPVVITTLAPELVFGRPLAQSRRVEVRSCRPGIVENLQIAAWKTSARKPSLLIETDDHVIAQVYASPDLVIVESGRDAYDTVTVIAFENGEFRVALKEVVRDPATILASAGKVTVTLTPVGGKQQSHVFSY